MIKIDKLSKPQAQLLTWWLPNSDWSDSDAIIADGAIRSGKTLMMAISFITWAMTTFDGQNFAICGKTIGSFRRNVLSVMKQALPGRGYKLIDRRADNLLIVSKAGVMNYFYMFGGKDERSQDLIQGITLAGVLLDEVVLMPRSFVDQALARCSVNGSKFWFNCNPAGQLHWFKQEWIDDSIGKNAKVVHFSMDDNPSLSEEVRRLYENMYSGVFYDRYIKGLWVAAEGLIYDMFEPQKHILSDIPETDGEYYVSSDFGIQNATTFLLWQKIKDSDAWICLSEYYYSGRDQRKQKTVAELVEGLADMLSGIEPKWIIVDPSAAALIVELRKKGYHVRQANNDVLNGIADVSTMIKADRLFISASCKNTINEFGVYCWDEAAAQHGEDRPVKEHDHAMDAVRYFVKTMKLVNRGDKVDSPLTNLFL